MKTEIRNRKNEKIVVLVEEAQNPTGLAFVMHGLSGNKEELHIALFAQCFKDKGFTVIRFDTTNTFGESDGNYQNATVTNYLEDLEDVISWAKSQSWYEEPYFLVGHSLGGISIIKYASEHPQEIKGLAPISTVVSGELSLQTAKYLETRQDWEKTGWIEEKSSQSPSGTKKLPWSHMEDRLKYDALKDANKLVMPVILIVGDEDDSTPPVHQKLLYEKLSGEKEIHIIKGAPHSFKDPKHLEEIRLILTSWIEKIQ